MAKRTFCIIKNSNKLHIHSYSQDLLVSTDTNLCGSHCLVIEPCSACVCVLCLCFLRSDSHCTSQRLHPSSVRTCQHIKWRTQNARPSIPMSNAVNHTHPFWKWPPCSFEDPTHIWNIYIYIKLIVTSHKYLFQMDSIIQLL